MKRFLPFLLLIAFAAPAAAVPPNTVTTTLDANESSTHDAIASYQGAVRHIVKAVADCRGTWDTATITFYVSIDGTNFVNAQDAAGNLTCTADCAVQFIGGASETFGPYRSYRLTMSGAGASSDVDCTITEGWK